MPIETRHRQSDERSICRHGEFTFRLLRIPEDIPMLHDWFTRDYASFWLMQDKSEEEVQGIYQTLMESGHATAYIGSYHDKPAFLIECYDPRHDRVGQHYAVRAGDLGMHLFMGPAKERIAGFSLAAFKALMRFMFINLAAQRIVVEPDVKNHKIHALNQAVGFVCSGTVIFAEKLASLAFCTRQDFEQAIRTPFKETSLMNAIVPHLLPQQPAEATQHLTPEVWAVTNRRLIRKALAEFAHELIIEPERLAAAGAGFAQYQIHSDDGTACYRFDAQILALRHWRIPLASIRKLAGDTEQPLDALQFIIDIRGRLGIKDDLLPIYLDEISSTLYGAAYKETKAGAPTAGELADSDDFQSIEIAMTEGHPGFVANNGRLGFDAGDYHAYAPEAGVPIRVVWLAVHKDNASFASLSDLSYQQLMDEELGAETISRFADIVAGQGRSVDDYYFMPAHPWQWFNKLSIAFAAYVARGNIICLGYGDDEYLAQQSIRTFFNISDRRRRYVKTSLSILNMGFMRGLSPYYMSGTPAINEYIKTLLSGDAYLRRNGFTILREVASLGFRNYYYEAAIAADSQHKKMFSALWRENPLPLIEAGERLMTMAALLHIDRHGTALLPELIRRSGLDTAGWLRRYLDAYLTPLVHCFYAHDLVFMPHGENLILVLEKHVPVRVLMKDIAEESAILDKNARDGLPQTVQRLAVDVPDEVKLLAIFIDVFDGFFRYVNQILVENGCCDEDTFWGLVAACIADYQREHPELSSKYRQYDLFAPEFLHSCLNRLQLGNNLQMINLTDPAANLKMAGNLINPIARFRPIGELAGGASLAAQQ